MSTRLVKCLLTHGAYINRWEADEITHTSHAFKSYSHIQGEGVKRQDALNEISIMGGVKRICGRVPNSDKCHCHCKLAS